MHIDILPALLFALALTAAACAVGYWLIGWTGVAWALLGLSLCVLALALWTAVEV